MHDRNEAVAGKVLFHPRFQKHFPVNHRASLPNCAHLLPYDGICRFVPSESQNFNKRKLFDECSERNSLDEIKFETKLINLFFNFMQASVRPGMPEN